MTAAVTITITTMVGVGVGLTVVERSAGCSAVYADIESASAADIERCRTALPAQLEVAAAGANFIPSGANETLASQLISSSVEQASRPVATRDAPLPDDVADAGEPEEDAGPPEPEPSDDPDEGCMVIGGAPIPGGLLVGLALIFIRARRQRT